jgi:hypothetical protein
MKATERLRAHEGTATAEHQADPLKLFILDPRTDAQKARDERAGRELGVAKILATYRNGRVLEDFPLRGGKAGKRFERIRAQQQAIRDYIDGEPGVPELPDDSGLRRFGGDLFECLLPGEVRRLYDSVRRARHGRLDILLTSMVHWVADLPWEFAFDTGRGAYLATEEINFVRNVVTAIPAEEINGRSGTLKILVVAAQPVGWGPVSSEEEIELLSRGFRGLEAAGLVEIVVLRSTTPETLHKRLHQAQLDGERFDVLHFIGHGEYDDEGQAGHLVFEDGRGAWSSLATDRVRQLVCRRGIRILFLNACETGSGGHSDFNRGVAQGLVAGGVPIVVGNQYKVLDSSATAFAQHFYWCLAHGATVGDAAREARVGVSYALHGEAIDWAVPVVFAQNPRETLCRPSAKGWEREGAPLATVAEPAARRSGRPPRRRIGLWDVNNALPQLPEIVSHLNGVQSTYDFEVVDITAPIGTWRLVRTSSGALQSYVFAEHVFAKLRDRPAQLGLRKLLCFTAFPLGDENFLNLYGWDEDEQDRIALFSFAGFEDALGSPDLLLGRAIANLVSGSLIPLQPHFDDVKTCPCYFNGERDPRLVAGPIEICGDCNEKLRKPIENGRITRGEVEAVKQLLCAYPEKPPTTGERPHSSTRRRSPEPAARPPRQRKKAR